MWKAVLQHVKATFPVIIAIGIVSTSYGQQNIIANKDNTRPELNRQVTTPANVSLFSAKKYNGYNDLEWTASSEQNTRRFIVEYSTDGVNYQTAGEVLSATGVYKYKHHILDIRPLLYRIRIEDMVGKTYYSKVVLLDGVDVLPVKIYPTVITGNIVNANAGLPVERVSIASIDGTQVFAKDMNGVSDFISIAIPSLHRGMYLITFYGNGWMNTQKFIIG